jgi:hypothetical protein
MWSILQPENAAGRPMDGEIGGPVPVKIAQVRDVAGQAIWFVTQPLIV